MEKRNKIKKISLNKKNIDKTINIDMITKEEIKYNKNKQENDNNISLYQSKLKEFEQEKIKVYKNEKLIEKKYNDYELNVHNKEQLEKELIDINKELNKCNEDMKEFECYEYDDKCKFCLKNTLTKQKMYIQDKINTLNISLMNKKDKFCKINEYIDKNVGHRIKYFEMIENKNKLEIKNKNIESISQKIENEIMKQKILDEDNKRINEMKNNIEYEKENKIIDKQIEILEEEINEIENMIFSEYDLYNELKNKVNILTKKYDNNKLILTNKKHELEKLNDEYNIIVQNKEKIDEYEIMNNENKQYDKEIKNNEIILRKLKESNIIINKSLDENKKDIVEFKIYDDNIHMYDKKINLCKLICNVMDNEDRLIVNIDSLHLLKETYNFFTEKSNLKQFDLIILDECESLLKHFESSLMNSNKDYIYSIFHDLISNTKKVICFDGDLSNRSYNYFRRFDANIKIYENMYLPRQYNFIIGYDEHIYKYN
jgi:hypothetical protein